MSEIADWLRLADKFAADGNAQAMFGAANEILALDKNSADGRAILAEANLYLGDLDAAENLAPDNLRGRLVRGGIAAGNFQIIAAIKTFREVADEARALGDTNTLCKALSWSANPLYLAGDARTAAENLREASALTANVDRAAELFSKHLFLKNYAAPADKATAQRYDDFFAGVRRYESFAAAGSKIRVGYISPDFRQHAVANFVEPLLNDFDAENFSVTAYHTGRSDFVTARLKTGKAIWRDLHGLDADTAARIIHGDGIDILVDLSGHTQNSCLPILARKPAPVQITAIGFTATTGLRAVDYFLSDGICAAGNDFTEKILRVDGCHLCYAPFAEIPAARHTENNFTTYGSFNNFAKISDTVLGAWRAILNANPAARLVLKNKTASIPDGREIIRRRLAENNLPLDRVELRAYSRDYLEAYREIDIALDTFPYNGGATTCEALIMGVPVVALRGDFHGARFGASILSAAGLSELIARDLSEYVRKAVELGRQRDLLARYHQNLREKLLNSRLMDGRRYARALEDLYRAAYKTQRNA